MMDKYSVIEELECAPGCRNVVAQVVSIGDKEMLLLGGLLVSKVSGVCVKCGRSFHWSVTDRLLESILKQIQNR